jgi:hypothetical protein
VTFWSTASFIAGLVPSLILLILYGALTAWYKTFTGWVLFGLIFVTAVSYGLTSVVLLWPDYWASGPGEPARIIIRWLVASVLWGLLAVFVRSRKSKGRNEQ